MTVELFDPVRMGAADWPPGCEALRALAEGICRHGSQRFVSNVRTRMIVLRDDDVMLPVTITDAEHDNSYVCSIFAMSQYMKEELKLIGSAPVRRAMDIVLEGAGAMIRLAELDKSVQVNNWLIETNPYPAGWRPAIDSITDVLTKAFPNHFVSFGSLNPWANLDLIDNLTAAGYTLGAFRQIYVYDNLTETYLPHEDVWRDRRLLRRTSYRVVRNHELGEADYPRMAELYGMLYLQKHSTYNPAYTTDYVRTCHREGILRFLGLRSPEGRLDGMLGLLTVNNMPPVSPIVGYDTTLDRRLGLFRMIIALIFETAMAEGWNVNLGGANAKFKRSRGGKPVIEYRATYCKHLSWPRRLALKALSKSSNTVGVPLMKWFEV
jgi:hypothetical protein